MKENFRCGTAGYAYTPLHGVGASYGVFKLVSDPPHWSDNGH
ncbi:MAG: hypothetical protein JWQ72_586 [Polaromonas sp.]|nr:hypothetical protein [Polaromonas sp.]